MKVKIFHIQWALLIPIMIDNWSEFINAGLIHSIVIVCTCTSIKSEVHLSKNVANDLEGQGQGHSHLTGASSTRWHSYIWCDIGNTGLICSIVIVQTNITSGVHLSAKTTK